MPATTPSLPSGRLVSLDVFRGATIAAMILVNNPGTWDAVYAPLRHADWHGWTFTDVILWIDSLALSGHMLRLARSSAEKAAWMFSAGAGGKPVSLHAWIFDEIFSRLASPINASLLFAIANVAVL